MLDADFYLADTRNMGAKKVRSYSKYTDEALALLGNLIQLERKTRRMSENDLADRIGISRATLRKIEKGNRSCEVGLVFEAAVIVGVPLFREDSNLLSMDAARVKDKIALLPKSIRKNKSEVEFDDNF